MTDYVTRDGFTISDEMVDKWAAEAEAGFPNSTVTPVEGRPWETNTSPMKPRTIRIPDTLWHLVEETAKDDDIPTAEFIRRALVKSIKPRKLKQA